MFTSVRSLNSSSLFEVSCKNPAKNIGNLESRDTFLRVSFPRFSRVVAFKLSDQCQMMSILEQPSRSLSDQGMKMVSLYSPNVVVLCSGRACTAQHHRKLWHQH